MKHEEKLFKLEGLAAALHIMAQDGEHHRGDSTNVLWWLWKRKTMKNQRSKKETKKPKSVDQEKLGLILQSVCASKPSKIKPLKK